MCGRFTVSVQEEELDLFLKDQYDIEEHEQFKLPRYNVAPGQQIITVINDGKNNRAGTLRWGFVPFFAKDDKIGYKMINAKAETLSEKPSFKHSFKHKRCVILADGFYEWKKDGKTKTPIRFQLKNQSLFSFAGLYSTMTKEDGSKLHTCTIITTKPNDLVRDVHNRMPVILNGDSEKIWLNPSIKDTDLLTSILSPYDSHNMSSYEVSSIVNHAKNDLKECIKPV